MREVTGRAFSAYLRGQGIAPRDCSVTILDQGLQCIYPKRGARVGKRVCGINDTTQDEECRYYIYEDADNE